MAMSCKERKAAQRSREIGYAKSRQTSWKSQGINPITYTEYLELIVAQKSQCKICGTFIDATSPLDHDHKTGEPRGVLCSKCNLFLGKFENDGSIFLHNAAQYLEQYSAV